MAIQIEEEVKAERLPVVKKFAIGETFVGGVIKWEQRVRLNKEQEPIINAKGRQAQELVITLVTMPGTTSEAGLGDDAAVPAPGELVRFILSGLAFKQWIDEKKPLGKLNVGDVLTHVTETAQVYDQNGSTSGGTITDQAQVLAARMKGKTVGVYGTLTLRRATPADAQWVQLAEAAHMAQTAIAIDVPDLDF